MQERAARRKRNFVKYAQEVGHWILLDGLSGERRAHWFLPEAERAAEPQFEPDVGSTSHIETGNGTRPENDRRRIDVEKDRIEQEAQAKDDWLALRSELLLVAGSGQMQPRIDARLIRVGVAGADLLLNGANGAS